MWPWWTSTSATMATGHHAAVSWPRRVIPAKVSRPGGAKRPILASVFPRRSSGSTTTNWSRTGGGVLGVPWRPQKHDVLGIPEVPGVDSCSTRGRIRARDGAQSNGRLLASIRRREGGTKDRFGGGEARFDGGGAPFGHWHPADA